MESPTASLKKKRRDSKLKDATELAALKLKSKKNVATNSSQKNQQNFIHYGEDENSSWLVSLREQGKKAFRCYVLGSSSVGKTSLCFRMSKNILVDVPSTDDEVHIIECNISKQQYTTNNNNNNNNNNSPAPPKKHNKIKLVPITLEVIDALSTSSEDISRKKREYPTAYICTYSVSDRESYEFAVNLIENLKIHAHAFHPIILASCKADLQNDPNQFEIKQIYASKFAAKHKVQFIATSSLNAIGIDELTSRVGELLLKYTKTYNKLNRISNGGNAVNKYYDSSDDENENKNNDSDIFACAVGNCGTGRDRNRYNTEKSIPQIDKYDRNNVSTCVVV